MPVVFDEFLHNVLHNLFKPLLLFFYAGFLVPILGVKLEFPKVLYQSITIYLLLAIGWHGGEELAGLTPDMLSQALGFMLIGFVANLILGFTAYFLLRTFTRLRRVDAATVAGYYGSDSAGTFVTCMGVLAAANLAYAAYMPVLLAVMEIPGCLVALMLVARFRRAGMDADGNMPDEANYNARVRSHVPRRLNHHAEEEVDLESDEESVVVQTRELVGAGSSRAAGRTTTRKTIVHHSTAYRASGPGGSHGPNGYSGGEPENSDRKKAEELEAEISLQPSPDKEPSEKPIRSRSFLSKELLHEVFLNPGIFLLFAGIVIGFVSRLQGEKVTAPDDTLFVNLFQGVLCLFLLEMGMTASKKLRDLKSAGWAYVAFALIVPNLFATFGMCIVHGYSLFLGKPFEIGTYALFAVLCGAASYIALPAVQRMAIPEASPTLPLAASLGVTFSYNVTIGIPLYLMIANALTKYFPLYV